MRIAIDDTQVKFKTKDASDLLVLPKRVDVIGNFNEDSAKKLYKDIDEVVSLNQKTIPIFIDSYGGLVHSLNGMADYFVSLRNDGYQIVTIACGKAMSCGAFLFMLGDKRYIGPRTTLMIHRTFGVAYGNADAMRSTMEHGETMEKLLFEECSENIGRKRGWLFKQLESKKFVDWYLPSAECMELGVATDLGIPRIEVKVKTEFNIIL